jgi:hypothetical protein
MRLIIVALLKSVKLIEPDLSPFFLSHPWLASLVHFSATHSIPGGSLLQPEGKKKSQACKGKSIGKA